ncbi:MAG: cation:proton antiporter, partial [Thermoanaerobaculia bacterium]
MNGDEHRLFTDIAIILGASFPMLYLGRLLKLPEVIAYLVTGVLIGPHALGLIRATEQVETTAEVGVALILFFIGLHVPMKRLRELGRTALVSGFLQMALTVVGIVIVAIPLGFDLRHAMLFGFLIALGSTAVVLPILDSRDETGSPFAQRFLAVSLFQDFAVIPLILLVPAFAAGPHAIQAHSIVIRLVVAIAGVILLVLAGRVVAPRLLARIAAFRSRELFTAGALVLIVGTIALAQRLGVSAALGAFAAGIIVGDTEFIHEVGGILRPFRDFLSALFFVSIGMLLQVSFVLENINAVIGVVIVVIVVKVIAAYPAFRASGAIERTSIRAAFAVAPIGEFSFLIAQEAKRFEILGPREEQMFMTIAVVTLAMTPILVAVGGRTAAQLRSGRTEQPPERR